MNSVTSHCLVLCVIVIWTIQIVTSTDCPSPCKCDDGFVICENAENVPEGIPASTSSLFLPENKIKTLSREDFTGFEANLELLDVSRGLLKDIAPGTFMGMEKLVTLDLSKTKLKSVRRDMFSGLSKLANLDLSSTSITSLTETPFHDLTFLKTLNLKGNDGLNSISDAAFAGLANLQELLLGGKKLQYIPKNALSHLHSINHIIFEDLPIVNLNSATFPDLYSLKQLCMDGWKSLERIDTGTIEHFPNLTDLTIRSTAMKSVPSLALTDLETLKLDNNKDIKRLHLNDFSGLPSLRDLSLRNTGLHSLQESYFRTNEHLVNLDLSQNQLSVLPTHTLFILFELQSLNVSNNNIPTLRSSTFENNQMLHLVDISHNPMICDCDLTWLKIWHESQLGERELIGTCDSPRSHAGIDISAIEHKYFVCHPPRFNQHNVTVGITTGKTATIDCVPEQASPDPDIIWKDSQGRDIPTYDEVLQIDPPPNIWQLANDSLHINSTTVSDFGVYRCTAENKEGKSLKTFTIVPESSYNANPSSSGSSVATGIVVTIGLLLPIGGILWYLQKRKKYTNLNTGANQHWQGM